MGRDQKQTAVIAAIEQGDHCMSAHNYRVTLEYLGGKHADSNAHAPLQFSAGNHDDLFYIIERVRAAQLTDADTAAALALGMKLFGEVLLTHRKDPLFAELQPAFRHFIGSFKERIKSGNEGQPQPLDRIAGTQKHRSEDRREGK